MALINKKKIVGMTLAGALAIGGTSVFAAAATPSLSEVKGVNVKELTGKTSTRTGIEEPAFGVNEEESTGQTKVTGKGKILDETARTGIEQPSLGFSEIEDKNTDEIQYIVVKDAKPIGKIPRSVQEQLAGKTTSAK
ncbi:hypothetical protein ACFOQM_03480 [Paenibacillus sp. GCM10012307]|uniref:Uncharacterized protein n=1 Tax=Paenibacillus roseus TaxID=2798579 RepID=A0A934IW33_9BACL|nr:hypothetical protein [Paenibacillus roseus]MBJ6360376.1 hypothetical protein [Paenibacillus roseus]